MILSCWRLLLVFLSTSVVGQENIKAVTWDIIRKASSSRWLRMVESNKSTLGENMNAEGYGTNHHPFGANVGHWFFRYVLGLKPSNQKGWLELDFEPYLPNSLGKANGSLTFEGRTIEVSLLRIKEKVAIELGLPEGINAWYKGELL